LDGNPGNPLPLDHELNTTHCKKIEKLERQIPLKGRRGDGADARRFLKSTLSEGFQLNWLAYFDNANSDLARDYLNEERGLGFGGDRYLPQIEKGRSQAYYDEVSQSAGLTLNAIILFRGQVQQTLRELRIEPIYRPPLIEERRSPTPTRPSIAAAAAFLASQGDFFASQASAYQGPAQEGTNPPINSPDEEPAPPPLPSRSSKPQLARHASPPTDLTPHQA